jgi:putative transposase
MVVAELWTTSSSDRMRAVGQRLWRSLKYEDIYLKGYATMPELATGLTAYFDFYNHQRPHQSLNYCTPAELYFA